MIKKSLLGGMNALNLLYYFKSESNDTNIIASEKF